MRRTGFRGWFLVALVSLATLAAPPVASAETEQGAPGPILGFADPAVAFDRGRFYVLSTTPSPNLSMPHLFGLRLPAAASDDLVHWNLVGEAMGASSKWADGDLWAPAISFADGRWWLYYAARDPGRNRRCIGAASSTSAYGPYTDASEAPILCPDGAGDVIDAEVFTDLDGGRWLLWKSRDPSGASRAVIWSRRMSSPTTLEGGTARLLTDALPWEAPVIEAPSMVRWQERYVLFYSAGTFVDARYSIGWALCDTPLGPCRRGSASPLLQSHADLVGPGGQTVFKDLRGRLRIAFQTWIAVRDSTGVHGTRQVHVHYVVGRPDAPRIVNSPFGVFDSAEPFLGGVRLRGWAIDPADEAPVLVAATAGGITRTVPASFRRPDVGLAFPEHGDWRGFDVTLPTTLPATVCVTVASGVALGCRTVSAPAPR